MNGALQQLIAQNAATMARQALAAQQMQASALPLQQQLNSPPPQLVPYANLQHALDAIRAELADLRRLVEEGQPKPEPEAPGAFPRNALRHTPGW